jgi:hypothetical protein
MSNATTGLTPTAAMGKGLGAVTSSPSAAGSFLGDNMLNIGAAAIPALAQDTANYQPTTEEDDDEESSLKRISSDFRAMRPPTPNPYYRAQYPSFAPGGAVAHLPVKGTYRDSDSATANKDAYEAAMIRLNKIRKGANLSSVSMPKSNVKGLGDLPELAAGGSLGGYSDGGRMLKGPGDGMSDSIPGVIGNKQPARLADGEFVVPADVVSHLGNGSTDAGAKKLYSMMDKIRKARTGTKKQGKKINPNKFLPA